MIQYLTVFMIFKMESKKIGNDQELIQSDPTPSKWDRFGKKVLLSVMMVYTFIGIFLHVPVHFYRVGMGSPSCTPVPSPNPSYSPGEE